MDPLMFDAAFPPSHMPDGYSVAAGYVGSNTSALHIWADAEWENFRGIKKLPIYVPHMAVHPVQANQTGKSDAQGVADHLARLNVPATNAVALDMETVVSAQYVNEFNESLTAEGYPYLWVYGSASTVFGNPECHGYWVADFTGQPFMYDHPNVRATQFKAGAAIDTSTVKPYQYHFHLHRW